MSRTLLLEIGTEELPADVIPRALKQLERVADAGLTEARLSHGVLGSVGTPRRLTLIVEGVAEAQSTVERDVKGPSTQIAFDAEGLPTPAAQGFARKQGVEVERLERRDTPQGAYVYAVRKEEGRPAPDVLRDAFPKWVHALQFPATMRWGSGEIRFARPIRWLVTLLGDRVIPWELDGLVAGRTTRGRRFTVPGEVEIDEAEAYADRLRRAGVEVDPRARREQVWEAVERAARSAGGEPDRDEELLDEVIFLIEEPAAVCGHYKEAYLRLPDPVLVTPMKEHQRYFPVVDAAGVLMPHFVTVTNGDHGDRNLIRKGNEKVLDARLSDAEFFFEEDLKRPLTDRVESLKTVLFQERLGSLYEKTIRVQELVRLLGQAAELSTERVRSAERAAWLCKADLVTHMVNEFAELQGVMGREYAIRQGEDERVADAILEHWLPRGASDALPESVEGLLVALADKLDTLVGCFGAGLIPTGSQDPYALRRQALGVLRILLSEQGQRLRLSLEGAIEGARSQYGARRQDEEWKAGVERLWDFFRRRMRGILLEKGLPYDAVDAVSAGAMHDVSDVLRRAETLAHARSDGSFADLVALFQRAANLVDRQAEEGVGTSGDGREDPSTASSVDPARFEEDEEKALYEALDRAAREVEPLYDAADYTAALHRLAALRRRVDAFFESVLVMAPDPGLRNNRLALLSEIVRLVEPLGNLRKIETAS